MSIILTYLTVNFTEFFWYIGLPIFVIGIIGFLIDLMITKDIEYRKKREIDYILSQKII